MSVPATPLSQGLLRQLYLQGAQPPPSSQPVLQLLAFEPSDHNPKEIILRVSDKQAFLDCLLVGPYSIHNGKILSDDRPLLVFPPLTLLKVSDYFYKLDSSKMCKLKVIIRRLSDPQPQTSIIGCPQEISQLVENFQPLGIGSQEAPIKLEETAIQYLEPEKPKPVRRQEQPLCLGDLLQNKAGFFIGRLLRVKFGTREGKEGSLPFLILGFLDLQGSLVRVNLAGRTAVRESREVRKGKCYLVRGLEVFTSQRGRQPMLRVKQRQFRLQEVGNEVLTSRFGDSYFRWEHQWEGEGDFVDVVGILEQIQQKASYRTNTGGNAPRDVVRVLIRNIYKTVRVSFWADQIRTLENASLVLRHPIMFQDIRRKKAVFLDFTGESSIILLDEDPLKQVVSHLLPTPQVLPQPTCVPQLLKVCQLQPGNARPRILNLYLVSLLEWRIFYRSCIECRSKVERVFDVCPECGHSNFLHRYNCEMELSDAYGSLICFAFDPVCDKLFGRTAQQLAELSSEELAKICQQLVLSEYRASLEFRNSRLILRSFERVNEDPITRAILNLKVILDLRPF